MSMSLTLKVMISNPNGARILAPSHKRPNYIGSVAYEMLMATQPKGGFTMARKSAEKKLSPEKIEYLNQIQNVLDEYSSYNVESAALNKIIDGLSRMSETNLGLLSVVLGTIPTNVELKSRVEPSKGLPENIEVLLSPAKTQDQMTEKLMFLRGMGVRVFTAWDNGDIPELKRSIRVTENILSNTKKLVQQQLWDNVR